MFGFIKNIRLIKYIYFNYFSKNIVREGSGKLLPFRNAIIDFAEGSKLYIGDQNIEIGTNKLKESKAETYVRLRKNAIWKANGGCNISYGSTIEILEDAKLETKFFTMNSFSTIVAGNQIILGEDVMIARNVTIFDSDFHNICYNEILRNPKGTVEIADHVWLGVNVTVLKNSNIGKGSIVAANTVVTSNTSNKICVMLGNKKSDDILCENIEWER